MMNQSAANIDIGDLKSSPDWSMVLVGNPEENFRALSTEEVFGGTLSDQTSGNSFSTLETRSESAKKSK